MLGRFVLTGACATAARWNALITADGGEPLRISVNLSGRELDSTRLVPRVGSALASSGLDPRRLCLEVTESVLVNDFHFSATVLRHLKELGPGSRSMTSGRATRHGHPCSTSPSMC